MWQMVGLADRVGSDAIPDVGRMSASIAKTSISYSFLFAKDNGRSAHDGGMRFSGN
jgi:hypothetical protein